VMAAVRSANSAKIEYSLAASENRDVTALPEGRLVDFIVSGIADLTKRPLATVGRQKSMQKVGV
jgi:hypothetical protein